MVVERTPGSARTCQKPSCKKVFGFPRTFVKGFIFGLGASCVRALQNEVCLDSEPLFHIYFFSSKVFESSKKTFFKKFSWQVRAAPAFLLFYHIPGIISTRITKRTGIKNSFRVFDTQKLQIIRISGIPLFREPHRR